MKKHEYTIEVVFSNSVYVDVYAEDIAIAMEEAENKASEIFTDDLNAGLLGPSDFLCEAQQP